MRILSTSGAQRLPLAVHHPLRSSFPHLGHWAMDWTHLLDPANGGPGESPGYREAIESLRANPPIPKAKRKAAAKQRPARFPSAKHASTD